MKVALLRTPYFSTIRVIPVVILTTSTADEDILKSYQLQASGYIKKPVDFRQFGHIIMQLQDYWFTVIKFPPKWVGSDQ